MTYLLDTNTCIEYLNGRSVCIRDRMASVGEQEICLCSVVKAELGFGVLKSTRPQENMERLRRFADRFASLPFDDAAGERYGEIRLALEKAGTPVGPNDLMIAGIALANGLTLVTHNTDEFRRIPGLRIADWESAADEG
jgi:tRNA(fMet)-specific endonuclease VapC